MKAIVYHNYGTPDVLRLEEVEKPTPKADEVLVSVRAASINAADWLLLNGKSFITRLIAGGLNKPQRKILGNDVAGRVEAVGSSVTKFKVGDEVYGDVSPRGGGGFAEYTVVAEKYLALKATTLTFEEAATVPTAGMTALQGLRDKGKIQSGQKVLITGASGGVGTFAVQLAKYFGAEVTAMCSTNKLDIVRSLGADRVIDYSKEDVTKMGQRFDLILDIAAYRPFAAYAPILDPDGIYVLAGGALGRIFRAMLLGPLASIGKRQTFGNVAAQPTQKDLLTLKELLEAGKVRPVIDRCYTLEELAEAMRYFGDRHVRGKVAITVGA